MPRHHSDYQVLRVAGLQRQSSDWMALGRRQHTMHGLVELDVTDARRAIREHRARTGEALSFTAFLVACLATAIGENPQMHAFRKGRNRLVLFDDVDVAVLVESEVEGDRIPVPHLIRAANRKTAAAITREIRRSQVAAVPYAALRRWLPLWLMLPAFIRQTILGWFLADPWRRKRLTGTTVVTAVGMFGRGTAWGIPTSPNYTLAIIVGGIARRPGIVSVADGTNVPTERIEVREYLSLTMSLDHDLVNGAPAARFSARLKELIEGGHGLAVESEADGDPDEPMEAGAS